MEYYSRSCIPILPFSATATTYQGSKVRNFKHWLSFTGIQGGAVLIADLMLLIADCHVVVIAGRVMLLTFKHG